MFEAGAPRIARGNIRLPRRIGELERIEGDGMRGVGGVKIDYVANAAFWNEF